MVNAKNLVKNLLNVGRVGRARKEVWMESAFDNTISLNDFILFFAYNTLIS
jgi:hypothetical protein